MYGHHAQWVDLGMHTEACMTRPDTCGAAGGAVSLWLREIECSDLKGMITSKSYGRTGFSIWCQDSSRQSTLSKYKRHSTAAQMFSLDIALIYITKLR